MKLILDDWQQGALNVMLQVIKKNSDTKTADPRALAASSAMGYLVVNSELKESAIQIGAFGKHGSLHKRTILIILFLLVLTVLNTRGHAAGTKAEDLWNW